MNIFEMGGEPEYPTVMIHVTYPDGVQRRVLGEVCNPEDFLMMAQLVANRRILPPNVGLALIRHEDEDND